MNIWILLLSVLPYVCISILVMSLVWRYDPYFSDDEKQPLKKITLISFPLFILFIFISPLIYLSFFQTGNVGELINWVKNIATLKPDYEVIVTSSGIAKLYVIFLSSILLLLSFPATFKGWVVLTTYLSSKLSPFFKYYRISIKIGVLFVISLFTITK